MTISACSSSLLSLLEISRTWNSFSCLCVRGDEGRIPWRTHYISYIVFLVCSLCVLVCLVMTFLRAKIAGQYDVHDPLKSRAMVSITASCTSIRLTETFLDVKETRELCSLRSFENDQLSANSQSMNITSQLTRIENVVYIKMPLYFFICISLENIWKDKIENKSFRLFLCSLFTC